MPRRKRTPKKLHEKNAQKHYERIEHQRYGRYSRFVQSLLRLP
ncbi:MAG: hypothetical protein ACLTLI_07860 [Clostridia bacterium]